MKNFYNNVDVPVRELTELVYNHFGSSPMSWTKIDKYAEYAHNNQFVEFVLNLYSNLEKYSYNIPNVINPSQLYKIIYKFQLASKELDYDIHLLEKCYLFFANYSVSLYNKMFDEANYNAKTFDFIGISDDVERKKIAFLGAVIRSFSEIVYCDEHTISGEILSPIYFSPDCFAIYRKYTNLNAFELYTDLKSFPFESIDLYYQYQGHSFPQTDIVGNFLTTDIISDKITGYYIVISGENKKRQIRSLSEIEQITNAFIDYISKIIGRLKKMDLEERLWKKIECEYYSLKDIAHIFGFGWQPNRYDISISKISDLKRPIVKANQEIALLTEPKIIKKRLFELNDPRVHWQY